MIGRPRRRPRLGARDLGAGNPAATDRYGACATDRHAPLPTDGHVACPTDRYAPRPADPHAVRPTDRHAPLPADPHAVRPTDPHAPLPADRRATRSADPHVARAADRRPSHPPARPAAPRISARRLAARAAAFVAATALAVVLVRFAAGVVSGLPFFQVDDVQVEGAVYLSRDEVRAAAGVASAANLWESKRAWVEGIESHPLVKTVEVSRRPPSTLLVRIEEVEPVALIASPLVEAVDESGAPIPVDPSAPVLDLPLLRVVGEDSPAPSHALPVLASEMKRMVALAPEVFSVVSEAHWEDGLVTLLLGDSGPRLRYRPPLSGRRLREGIVAMNDALERFPDRPPREVDLRFDGQVVVRSGDQVVVRSGEVRSGEGDGPP